MTITTRRTALLAGAAAIASLTRPALAALPPADGETINQVQSYLDGLKTLKARFQQLASNGELAKGTLYLQRPRRIRFAYDPPSQILLIATDWRLIFQDASVKQINVIPVRETPLGFLLSDRIKLSGDVKVTEVAHRGGEVALQLVRADEPDQGNVVLFLAEKPMELRRWTVTDAQGLATQIILDKLETNVPIDSSVFVWRDPQLFGWPEK